MARYKHYDYNQMTMVPVVLEEQLSSGTLEFAIHHLIDKHLDLKIFNERHHNDKTGRKAIDPKVLLKIILFRYSKRTAIVKRPRESLQRECDIYGTQLRRDT